MKPHRSRLALAFALACGSVACAQAATAKAAAGTGVAIAATGPAAAGEAGPERSDDRALFADLPPPWREYFLQAHRAEALDDRLARCLAYPDLPGNAWPKGYGEAHCRYHFEDPLPLAEIGRLVDAGDIATLEQRIRGIYSHHREPAGEGVHRVFANFSDAADAAGDEALRIAERWVEQAPESGYAALAVGEVWRGRGWQARGSAFVRDTPPAALRRMETLHEQAAEQFRRAAALQPDLIDAYIGLVNIGKAQGDDAAAFAKARALDPGCGELAYETMTALRPRWGGSREALDSYASRLEALVDARPLLANQLTTPISDYVDSAERAQRHSPEALDLLDRAVRQSGEESSLRMAAEARLNIQGERRDVNRAIAELAQVGRFNDRSAWADGQVGWFLVRRDPAWALRVLRHGVQLDPSSAWLHYLLGASAYNAEAYEEAEKHYLIAAIHDDYSLDALRELSEMWLTRPDLPLAQRGKRAQPFIEQLLQAHPNDGRGLMMRVMARAAREPGYRVGAEAFAPFLAHADLGDPWQKRQYDMIRSVAPGPGAAPSKPAPSKPGKPKR